MSYSYYPAKGATTIATGVTTVDCQKQVRSWRLLRSLIELLIPTCICTFVEEHKIEEDKGNYVHNFYYPKPAVSTNISPKTIITGTMFGYRHGKVSFCIQTDSKSTTPILLLELAVPTAILAREMQGGMLRISLTCNTTTFRSDNTTTSDSNNNGPLLSMPVWTMFCNGRKVGNAIKCRPSKADMEMLGLIGSVVAGAGIISSSGGKDNNKLHGNGELMYLRANFNRLRGSSDSESFHLIDPEGSIGQELSIFFNRSR